MTQTRFDPGGFYQFDLSEGAVRTRAGTRMLVLSTSGLTPLVATAVWHGDLTPVRRLGKELGEHVSEGLGGAASERSPEEVLGHAAGILALHGWGRLGMERWGDVVVVRLAGAPAIDDRSLGVAALLGGLFSALAGREVACVPADEDRFVLVDPAIAEEVWG
ncbi:MAG: hypothetical protein ACOCUN_02730, partial [Jiangellaceae bacterium]